MMITNNMTQGRHSNDEGEDNGIENDYEIHMNYGENNDNGYSDDEHDNRYYDNYLNMFIVISKIIMM